MDSSELLNAAKEKLIDDLDKAYEPRKDLAYWVSSPSTFTIVADLEDFIVAVVNNHLGQKEKSTSLVKPVTKKKVRKR